MNKKVKLSVFIEELSEILEEYGNIPVEQDFYIIADKDGDPVVAFEKNPGLRRNEQAEEGK